MGFWLMVPGVGMGGAEAVVVSYATIEYSLEKRLYDYALDKRLYDYTLEKR